MEEFVKMTETEKMLQKIQKVDEIDRKIEELKEARVTAEMEYRFGTLEEVYDLGRRIFVNLTTPEIIKEVTYYTALLAIETNKQLENLLEDVNKYVGICGFKEGKSEKNFLYSFRRDVVKKEIHKLLYGIYHVLYATTVNRKVSVFFSE